MSKLEQLIKELCPDGVEFAFLGALEDSKILKLGRGNVISRNDLATCPGDYPVYSSSASDNGEFGRYGNYMFEDERLTWSIDGGGRFFYRPMSRYSVTNVCGWLKVMDNNALNIRYLYHVLTNQWDCKRFDYTKKAHPSTIRNEYSIPLPPLPIQEEIVRILDNFTELIAELTAELTAEHTARKKQYEYYRDSLLAFGDDVEYQALSECCIISAGGDVPKDRFSKIKTEQYSIPIYSNGIGDNALYGYTDLAKIEKRCVTIAARGTIGYAALRKEPFYPIIRLICAIPKEYIVADFLYYVIEPIVFHVPTSGIPQLTVPMVSKYTVPIPYPHDIGKSLAEQARIVDILDRFDTLCNDITVGLPAEIKARQQQYEYYRDKLLTFQRLN